MKNIRLLFFPLTVLSLYLTACTKTGPPGAQGPAGTNGSNGADGNANVFTDTLTVESTEWAHGGVWEVDVNPSISLGYGTMYYDVPFDKITSGIIDSGMVSVYITPYKGGYGCSFPICSMGTPRSILYTQ